MGWNSRKGVFEVDSTEESLKLFQPDVTLSSSATSQTITAAFGAFASQNNGSISATSSAAASAALSSMDLADGAGGTGGTSTSVAASSDQRINGLLTGVKWSTSTITYTDPDAASDYQSGYFFDSDGDGISAQNDGFGRISAGQLLAVHFALNDATFTEPAGSSGFAVEAFTNLGIDYGTPGAGTGTIRVANTSDNSSGWTFFPASTIYGGDAWMGTAIQAPVQGSYAWNNTIHELGHALGLKHGHEAMGPANTALPSNWDSLEFSVMTYRSFIGDDTSGYNNEAFGYPQTYMMLDIAALQYMYGADFSSSTTNVGDTIYMWSPTTGQGFVNGLLGTNPGGNRIFETIWDGGGVDTYDLSNYTTNLTIDLGPGGYSTFSSTQLAYLGGGPNGGYARGNVFNALQYQNDPRSLIENAIGGSGNDRLIGNNADNRLTGGAGQDYFDGGGGIDTADYSYNVTTNNQWTFDLTSDLAISAAQNITEQLISIENVIGSSFADTFIGDSGTNEFHGGGGDDIFRTGGGADFVYGGLGGADSGTADRAVFTGNYSAYNVVSVSSSSGQVVIDGPEGFDTFLGVEWFQFQDQTIWWQNFGQTTGSVSINDVTISEGNSGTKVATFTVTRTGGTAAFNVNFATSNGGATTADSDYVANSGTLHFDANVNTQAVSVTVNGDTKIESDEAFFVLLSGATNGAAISDDTGIGTITNDDGGPPQTPTLTLSPATVTHNEGNAGTTDFTFLVTLTGTSSQEITAQWFTTWSSTFDLADFTGAYNGNLSFMPGSPSTQTITMHVLGDTVVESDESFVVHLTNASGAQIDANASLATGSVLNDDTDIVVPGSVSINDVSVTEGNAGTKVMNFTVTRTGGTAAFAVNFTTANGSATVADGDYVANSGTLNFGANVNTQQISVTINGDTKVEPDENFFVNLSGATNGASISDSQGLGTILNDDPAKSSIDFNSDGHPDILWQNDNGSASIWTLGGTNFTGGIPLGNDPGPDWLIKDTADFNSDGHPDILWQNKNTGSVSIWTLGGTNFTAGIPLGNDPGPSWLIKDTADFNNDGHPDILWQNKDTGSASIWTLGGTNFTAGIPLGNDPGPAWRIMDTADFNRDGRPDILWQNKDTGSASIWTLGGTNFTAGIALGNDPGPTWQIKKALDFTRDGIADILWQNNDGSVGIWQMGGTNVVGGAAIGSNPGPTWHIKDAADYNSDGNPDILFQNDNGSASIWTLDNHFNVTAFFPLGNDPGASWHIIV